MSKQLRMICLFLLAAAIITGCGNKSKKETTTGPATKPSETPVAPQNTDTTASFIIRVLPDMEPGIPQNLVLFTWQGKETIIDTVNNCSPIMKDEYARYEIPAAATQACGGWYAGGGDYYYLIMRDGKPVVYAGWQDEGQDDEGYHWEERKIK